jgi:hypothetical protein
MISERDPRMGLQPAADKLRARSRWRLASLAIGGLVGLSGTLAIGFHYVVEPAQEAAARAH